MAKKTKTALKELIKALEKQVETLEDPKSNRGKRDRATARVRAAAIQYGSAIHTRTGGTSPFLDIPDPRLDESTVASLKAEKNALEARRAAKHADKIAGKAADKAGKTDDGSEEAPAVSTAG
jgi:cell division septum initiation protein DivIVA